MHNTLIRAIINRVEAITKCDAITFVRAAVQFEIKRNQTLSREEAEGIVIQKLIDHSGDMILYQLWHFHCIDFFDDNFKGGEEYEYKNDYIIDIHHYLNASQRQ